MKKPVSPSLRWSSLLLALLLGASSCKKEDTAATPTPTPTPVPTPTPTPAAFDINSITDTYANVAALSFYAQWGPYNVHDPAVIKADDGYYYMYSTDVGYGISDAVLTPGLQMRRSKDLVQWEFVGWALKGLPPLGVAYITQRGGTPNKLLWAPYVLKVGSEYRLYYSLASDVFKLSTIGLATASSPTGPWTEKGLVVTTDNSSADITNGIDPTVIIDQQGQHRMYYGSAFDGIHMVKLDAATGLNATPGDRGPRIAQRGFTGTQINGNIEGPEIIYNAEQKKYYLFISYDWLQTKYNVRVGRADSPAGPFLDFKGRDINLAEDHGPMILAPYQFSGHSGWQGTGHCGVFSDGNGQYFMAHQGRPGIDSYYMDLHVRKIFWTPSGWPVVSPERYAGEDNSAVAQADLAGTWEQITLNYIVIPGYANEQLTPNFQYSTALTLAADGTFGGATTGTWTYAAPWLTLRFGNGTSAPVYVQQGRDWENKKATIIFTGLDTNGTAIWGKKK
ncbi:arabinan endo-1,5-alpha-L-arabinosidase [Hymenobacter sp. UV11]|uniref:arabinan endo-1,5-alpha-L-arabinosidase n=1 Tax=Hymenobacter sp. UV11 TaxID=1849735 RepID=UPI00105D7B44|nr:arabinan endo-1,5-alpha-L-arabinosidase [Hymenobacter sp. UV11]TDN39341.1 endo-arabinase [Hymenobacter sp. UV11]TFZ65576.1 arabinan endo-1,5-alpha-L-arabinosidase [Hymenobacter sp. UV11]